MTDTVSLSTAHPAMAELVSSHGWSIREFRNERNDLFYAAIAKDGVVLSYWSMRAEADYAIALEYPTHPQVNLHEYCPPSVSNIFAAVNIPRNTESFPFSAVDQNIIRIKEYLSDKSVFESHVMEAAERTAQNYRSWSDAPGAIAELAQRLTIRHPWLVKGRNPNLSDLIQTEPDTVQLARVRSAVVIASLGLSLILARCFG